MFDCSTNVKKFHDAEVTLPQSVQDILRDHRSANQNRLKSSLETSSKPQPTQFVKQGSYAMKTMIIQAKDYDIDDGAVFATADLGVEMTCDSAKMMVCDALTIDTFKTPPEIRDNCVRVYYAGNYHVDIPVYRTADGIAFELASREWIKSDPKGVTRWFEENLRKQVDSGHQLRRMVRYLKKFAKSRESWKLPSGFAITILAIENYEFVAGRDDEALRNLMTSICSRLQVTLTVTHPIFNNSLTDGKENQFIDMRDKLQTARNTLEVLDDPKCNMLKALKAWKEVFSTNYFDEEISQQSNIQISNTEKIISTQASLDIKKDGERRFG